MKKKICKYGKNCYRVNDEHLQQFDHPWRENATAGGNEGDASSAQVPQGDDHKEAAPASEDRPVKRPTGSLKDWIKTDFEGAQPIRAESKRRKVDESDKSKKQGLKAKVEPEHEEAPSTSVENGKQEEAAVEDPGDVPEAVEAKVAFIKERFLFEAGEDLIDFWMFCCQEAPHAPSTALKCAGIRLGGPLSVFKDPGGAAKAAKKHSTLVLHDRFYYDPPDFQTVLAGSLDGFRDYHVGYLRPQSTKAPTVLCSNRASKDGTLTVVGDNLFAACKSAIETSMKETKVDNGKCKTLLERLKKFADQKGYHLEAVSPKVKERRKLVVAKTLHSAGIVVPVVNDVGYRELPETDVSLRKLLKLLSDAKEDETLWAKRLEPFEHVMSLVQFANDEGDFGEGLELGLDLFWSGLEKLHPFVKHLLSTAYTLLGYPDLVKVLDAHLASRKNTTDVCLF